MKMLVLNAGSSSLKYQVIDMSTEKILGKGIVERIGQDKSLLTHDTERERFSIAARLTNHTEAFKLVISTITDSVHGFLKSIDEISAIGHRVLHGAEDYTDSVIVDDAVLETCRKNAVLGPLHQNANLDCIVSCQSVLPGTPNVAVFDTVFHSTMPSYAYMYAIDYSDYEKYKVRRYGFHGTSHKFVTGEAIKYLNSKHSKIITCHLGNGSSLAAVVDGRCIDTSMGLTPLEGVIMGTRSGDCDPALVTFLAEQKKTTPNEIVSYLNKKCGFLGLAGVSDFRDLTALANKSNDSRAKLAVEMFAYRIRKYIGSYFVAMGGLDCIVFTGGIGENASFARSKICEGLECLGVDFDTEKNEQAHGSFAELHRPSSKVKIVIIPTNEELVIARDAKRLIFES
ncbi:MAG: acetate kinase [Christensenellaceae bacterium]|nr:acetate kinase [Christensenellaceae bacterium]